MNESLYRNHLDEVQNQWARVLERNQYDSVIIAAGSNPFYFDDDQNPPFRANPHFLRWVPHGDCENSVVVLNGSEKPLLLWYSPKDYWYLPPSIPDWLLDLFQCQICHTEEEIVRAGSGQVSNSKRVAYVGPEPSRLLDIDNADAVDAAVLDQLAYLRAFKTPFEIDNTASATRIGVIGHLAAKDAFFNDGSELDIHLAYLNASRQNANDLPYQSIVALNEHASTLHYQHYVQDQPHEIHSLLIDAGGKSFSYHSDITRTYSRSANDDFDAVIASVHRVQQQLITEIGSFKNFVALHERMMQLIGTVLVEHNLVQCSAESAYDQQLVDIFYPHGTGHLLGLQTHDVGGYIVDELGKRRNPPERFPTLRLTRDIEPEMIFTIEPGIYFIPMLLETIADHADVNWLKVEALLPYGGIRIEDNVHVLKDGVHNFTRTAFHELSPVATTF